MAFFLFILVNATLFVRPAEIVPAMQGWEVYFYLILVCFIVAGPDILRYFTENSLETQPITLAALGLLMVIFLSGLLAGGVEEALRTSIYFAKVLIYYVLFVSVVTTSTRLRTLLICILMFCGLVAALAVLRYHDLIQLDTIKSLKDTVEGKYGEAQDIERLQGTGIFQDPNELCVLLAAMVPLSVYFLATDRNVIFRSVCLGLLPLFGYAIYLTHSRGGFIAFVGGLATVFWMRHGWKKTALIGLVGLPALLVVFGGRQTEISMGTGTARTRIELWRDWMMTFRENPATGKAMSLPKENDLTSHKADVERRHLAHNSYLQAFADLGIFGGCLFIGAFLTACWSIYRLHARNCFQINQDLKEQQPYIMGCVTAYSLGMMTLSICFIIPTYMMLALAVAYTQMARRSCLAAQAPLCVNAHLLGRVVAAGMCFMIGMYFFIRVFA